MRKAVWARDNNILMNTRIGYNDNMAFSGFDRFISTQALRTIAGTIDDKISILSFVCKICYFSP